MKFSSTSIASMQGCLYPLFHNQRPHFLQLPLFLIIYFGAFYFIQERSKNVFYNDNQMQTLVACIC